MAGERIVAFARPGKPQSTLFWGSLKGIPQISQLPVNSTVFKA
jgi:hypothetical protein